jgi:hypothetical protein
MVLTYEIKSDLRLPSGRSAGTGVSVGAVPVKRKGAADAPEVKVLPPEYALKRPFELDPINRGQLKQDASPESPVYFEATLLETDVDPADVVSAAERSVQVRLVRREVL